MMVGELVAEDADGASRLMTALAQRCWRVRVSDLPIREPLERIVGRVARHMGYTYQQTVPPSGTLAAGLNPPGLPCSRARPAGSPVLVTFSNPLRCCYYPPMAVDANGQQLPTAEDEAGFWALLEVAWAPLGPEVNQARRTLAARVPGSDVDISVLDDALGAFLDNVASACRELSGDELTKLDRVLERRLYDIDRADIQAVTDGSDDGFLYARGFIVAMGRDFYDAVTRDPEMAVLDAECEEMCYFFAHLYRKRWGGFPETGSGISRESCSNPVGWAG